MCFAVVLVGACEAQNSFGNFWFVRRRNLVYDDMTSREAHGVNSDGHLVVKGITICILVAQNAIFSAIVHE